MTTPEMQDIEVAQKAALVDVKAAEVNNEVTPLFLVLSRKGLVDTQLVNPHTGDMVYRIRDTGRGSLSSKPDFEVYRPGHGDLFVGSIRFGRSSVETNMQLTGSKAKGIEKVKLRHAQGPSDFVWKVIKSKRRVVKDRWLETNDDGISQLFDNEEVIVLHMVSANKPEEDPICIVRLNNTQPTGRIEFWTKEALVENGGDWNALDELVVSAYANMEYAKRDLMSGMDPSSWRGAAF